MSTKQNDTRFSVHMPRSSIAMESDEFWCHELFGGQQMVTLYELSTRLLRVSSPTTGTWSM